MFRVRLINFRCFICWIFELIRLLSLFIPHRRRWLWRRLLLITKIRLMLPFNRVSIGCISGWLIPLWCNATASYKPSSMRKRWELIWRCDVLKYAVFSVDRGSAVYRSKHVLGCLHWGLWVSLKEMLIWKTGIVFGWLIDVYVVGILILTYLMVLTKDWSHLWRVKILKGCPLALYVTKSSCIICRSRIAFDKWCVSDSCSAYWRFSCERRFLICHIKRLRDVHYLAGVLHMNRFKHFISLRSPWLTNVAHLYPWVTLSAFIALNNTSSKISNL